MPLFTEYAFLLALVVGFIVLGVVLGGVLGVAFGLWVERRTGELTWQMYARILLAMACGGLLAAQCAGVASGIWMWLVVDWAARQARGEAAGERNRARAAEGTSVSRLVPD